MALTEDSWRQHKATISVFLRRKGDPEKDDEDICFISDLVATLYAQVTQDLVYAENRLKELEGTLKGSIRRKLLNSTLGGKVTEAQIDEAFLGEPEVLKAKAVLGPLKAREAYLQATLQGSLPAKRQYIERHKNAITSAINNQ